jgi:hypothetical protein
MLLIYFIGIVGCITLKLPTFEIGSCYKVDANNVMLEKFKVVKIHPVDDKPFYDLLMIDGKNDTVVTVELERFDETYATRAVKFSPSGYRDVICNK